MSESQLDTAEESNSGTSPEGVETQTLVEVPKAELLGFLEAIRYLASDYGHVLEQIALSDDWDEKALEKVHAHREKIIGGDNALAKTDLLVGLLHSVLKRADVEKFTFRIPTRVGLLPEMENKDLEVVSGYLKSLGIPLERLVSDVTLLVKNVPEQLQEKVSVLLQGISSLFKALVRQDWGDVDVFISHINLVTTSRESLDLVEQIAKIARDIYNSLNEFSEDFSVESLSNSTDEIPDAVIKLKTVIIRLEDAANQNLEGLEKLSTHLNKDKIWLEESLNVLDELQKELNEVDTDNPEIQEKLDLCKKTLHEEIKGDISHLLERANESSDLYLTLIANQGFQDLTGQTLKKVIEFVEGLQFKLIEMLPQGSQQNKLSVDTHESEGSKDLGMKSQDQVDSLLADLGF